MTLAPPIVGSPSPRTRGLAWRLYGSGVALALLALLATGWVLRAQVRDALFEIHAAMLGERAERVAARLEREPADSMRYAEPASADEFSRIFSGWYWRLRDGDAVLRSRSLWDADLQLRGDPLPHGLQRARGPRGESLLLRTQRLAAAGADRELLLAGPADPLDRQLQQLDRVLAVTLPAGALALLLAAWLQVRLGLRPLHRLRRDLEGAIEGRRPRVGRGYGADLDPLAAELDSLFQRNERIVERGRSHAADLAHGLKKPLSTLLALHPAAGDQVPFARVRQAVEQITRLVDRHLARASSGASQRQRVDVGACIDELLSLMRQMHGARGLQWEAEVEAGLDWQGERTDLEEMLGNLLDNAGKWAATRVHVRAARVERRIALQVADDGPGLEPAQYTQATQRGLRFDQQRSGQGLGLAITADIAETYDGVLELEPGDGAGLRARLLLPG